MNTIQKFFSSPLFQIILSSAVAASIATGIFNYQGIRETNKRILAMEEMKREAELETYRYTKIHANLEEMNVLPGIVYNYMKEVDGQLTQDKEMFGQVVSKTTERYSVIVKLFDKSRPLMDVDLLSPVDIAIAEVERQSNELTKLLYSDQSISGDVDVVALMQARIDAQEKMKAAMVSQIQRLTRAQK